MIELLTGKKMVRSIREHISQLLDGFSLSSERILTVTREHFPTKVEVEDRFTRTLNELVRNREEQNRKWEEQKAEDRRRWEEQKAKDHQNREEQNRKWEEQNRKWEEQKAEDNRKWEEQSRKWEEQKAEDKRKWEEQNRKWEEQKAEDKRKWEERKAEDNRKWEEQNQRLNERIDEKITILGNRLERSIGALGSRWGLQSEKAFRDALAAILVESFGVEVLNVNEFDEAGEVFGRPDQIELDVLIKNGVLIICELKSSVSKSEMQVFWRKVRFYERRHQRKATRMIVVSPMLDHRARPLGEELGIEMYPDSMDVPLDVT